MKKRTNVFISIILLVSLLLSACGKKGVSPVAINEKTDKCSVCNMAAMNNQFATEIILENGKVYPFDDIGCMYNWMIENKDKKIEARFVRDYNSKDWISLEKAHFVYAKNVNTPMSYNVVTFKVKSDAMKFSKEHNGQVMTYQEMNSHNWNMNMEMKNHMKSHMNNKMNKDINQHNKDMK